MSKIVIKTRVDFDFLGKDYEGSYLTFRSIPISKYQDILDQIPKDPKGTESLTVMLTVLKEYFLEGEFTGEKLEDSDLEDLNAEAALKCFERLMGTADPKGENSSSNPSGTNLQPQ